MGGHDKQDHQEDGLLDTFAAEVTAATYPVALKYGVLGSSVDLELEIWKTVTALVRERGIEVLRLTASSHIVGAHCS